MNYSRITRDNIDKEHICCAMSNKQSNVKKEWLKQHLPSVRWDRINIVPYGTPKQNFCFAPDDILFDDETPNREKWTGKAYRETEILEILKTL